MVSIKAMRAESGKPIPSCRVSVYVESIFAGGSCERFTNDDGVAVFETIDPGTYTLYIEGVEKSNVKLKGEVVLYI